MSESGDMVERVARAMEPRAFDIYSKGYTAINWIEERSFLNAEKVVKRTIRKARAAIEALREPTEAMLAAGANRWETHHPGATESYPNERATWRAMIDAALAPAAKDEGEG